MPIFRNGLMLSVLLCLGVVAGCGVSSAAVGAGDTSTPTGTSGEGTMTPGKVTLLSSKNQYTTSDRIDLTILNGLTTTFTVADHQSFCSIVTLQYRNASGTWQTLGECLLKSPTRMITLAPHSTTPVQLPAPSSGWAQGSYQVILQGTPASTATPITITFTIQ